MIGIHNFFESQGVVNFYRIGSKLQEQENFQKLIFKVSVTFLMCECHFHNFHLSWNVFKCHCYWFFTWDFIDLLKWLCHFFGIAAMPFPCNGIVIRSSNVNINQWLPSNVNILSEGWCRYSPFPFLLFQSQVGHSLIRKVTTLVSPKLNCKHRDVTRQCIGRGAKY